MQVSGLTLGEFSRVVAMVSPTYSDNVIVHQDAHDTGRQRFTGRLWVRSSRGPGARRSWSGRRMPAACWHAYRDVLGELFELYPHATVRTTLAVYRGKDGFHAAYPATAYHNVGSMMQPAFMPELCECADSGPRPTFDEYQTRHIPEPVPARRDEMLNPNDPVNPLTR